MKRGFYFTIDALIAFAVVVGVILVSSSFYIHDTRLRDLDFAEDLMGVLNTLTVGDYNDSYTQQLIATGVIKDPDHTLLEQIGEFYALGNSTLAENLTKSILDPIMPAGFSYGLWADNTVIHIVNYSAPRTEASYSKFVSGIEFGRPIQGFIASIFLTGIGSRRTSTFIYFGGFVGQGNLSRVFFVPENSTTINITIELDVSADFLLYINDVFAGDYEIDTSIGYLRPQKWEVSQEYIGAVQSGENNLSLIFGEEEDDEEDVQPHYVGGGYIKVTYATNSSEELGITYTSNNTATTRHYLEGIDGFIDLFSSFYIPGTLDSISIFLDYVSNYTIYMKIANSTVYRNSTKGAFQVTISNQTLATLVANASLSYNDLSLTTVPLRIGLEGVVATVNDADMVLVTDVSGSMEWCTNQTQACCTDSSCYIGAPGCSCGNGWCGYWDGHWQSTCAPGEEKRINAARNASEDFIDDILSNTGTQIGLVSYATSTGSTLNLTANSTPLKNELATYDANGGTCICCGINSAVSMLTSEETTVVVPRASTSWTYTYTEPSDSWNEIGFDDSDWFRGDAPLGRGYYSWFNGFDYNTQLNNYKGEYWFRKTFNMSNVSEITDLKVSVNSDDGTEVFVNGNSIQEDNESIHYATYWNHLNVDANENLLVEGENVLGVLLTNERRTNPSCWIYCNFMDVEVSISRAGEADPTFKAIIVMSDGQANYECAQQGSTPDLNGNGFPDDAGDDAIQAACDAYTQNGISVYSVGFGADADQGTLGQMAACANGEYFNTTSSNELSQIYQGIAETIIQLTETQVANVSNIIASSLSPYSYIEFNFTPVIPPRPSGMIPVSLEGDRFGNNLSQGILFIPGTVDLVSLKSTSYSADKWTHNVSVTQPSSSQVYDLSAFSSNYFQVGDPYEVSIPVSTIQDDQNNTILVLTGISPGNNTGGSVDNRLIYDVRIPNSVSSGAVFDRADGCIWELVFVDGSVQNISVPSSYVGVKTCSYANQIYDTADAINDAAYRLFEQLDFDNSGRLHIKLAQNELDMDTTSTGGVPSMWGPARIEVRVWS